MKCLRIRKYCWFFIFLICSCEISFILWSIRPSLVSQLVNNPPAVQETGFNPWVGKVPWTREWLPTPAFWPGEFHGQKSLSGYRPWGQKESDMTEWLSLSWQVWGFPGGASDKELTCQCRRHQRHGFDPWMGRIPWRRKWQPTSVLLSGESHGQRSLQYIGLQRVRHTEMT